MFKVNKRFLREFLVNFAVAYCFVVGTVFASYSIYRGLFPDYYYAAAFIAYVAYFVSWAVDKKRYLHEARS